MSDQQVPAVRCHGQMAAVVPTRGAAAQQDQRPVVAYLSAAHRRRSGLTDGEEPLLAGMACQVAGRRQLQRLHRHGIQPRFPRLQQADPSGPATLAGGVAADEHPRPRDDSGGRRHHLWIPRPRRASERSACLSVWRLARTADGAEGGAVSSPPDDPPTAELGMEFAALVRDYERHLQLQRELSPHTVRAYRADVTGLLRHLRRMGLTSLDEVTVRSLRSWLAHEQTRGQARSTLQRRSAAVRVFFEWAQHAGRAATNPAASLRSPRKERSLPPTLDQAHAVSMLDGARAVGAVADGSEAASSGEPAAGSTGAERHSQAVRRRDVAVLETLYATGVRVAELCGLDLPDIDAERRALRVLGKGRKERTVPVGLPALQALQRWLSEGRPELSTAASGAAVFLGERGGRDDPRGGGRGGHPAPGPGGGAPGPGPPPPPPREGPPPPR